MTPTSRLAVVILTLDEEPNIRQCLESVLGWADEVFVLDSGSRDATVEIARASGAVTAQNPFVNYSRQRNHAINELPIRCEWILFLDADEWMPGPLKQEISALLESSPVEDGFYIKWRMIWMGRWIRRGYYPTWILRLFRHGKAHCEDRAVNEHLIVEGSTGHLRHDFMHEDRKGVFAWIAKHNEYATREASELLAGAQAADYREIDATLTGTQAQRKRWVRYRIWNRLPPLLRPFLYFFYRYVIKGGFVDGREGFIFHFLHALWYPLLIDVKYIELKMRNRGLIGS
ncbi:MAG: glycosyltransferase family 2 protein [Solirubrobacterales bacterium]|nr:glycosyltransferase family 2 protein [Solirubrobacterales bacterium]